MPMAIKWSSSGLIRSIMCGILLILSPCGVIFRHTYLSYTNFKEQLVDWLVAGAVTGAKGVNWVQIQSGTEKWPCNTSTVNGHGM